MPRTGSETDRLTVVHVTAPALVGGLESVVQALARGHAARGHHVHVVSIFDRGSVEQPLGAGIPGVETHVVQVPARRYWQERAAVSALIRGRATVVHTHGYRPDVIDASVARTSGIPVLSTVHGFTGGGLKNRVFERLQRRALRRMDAVVAVSRPLADLLQREGIRSDRLHVIPNAIAQDVNFLTRAEAREALGIPADRQAIGWVGRFTQEKGPDVFVRAIASLGDVDAIAVMIGAGHDYPAVAAEADRSSPRRFKFPGLVPEAARYLRAFDVLVLSSRTEGTPMILLEGIAAGVPVVATKVGGVPDVLTHNDGALVPAEDPHALAAAIRLVFDDPEAARVRALEASRHLASRNALEPWLRAYEVLYATLANSR